MSDSAALAWSWNAKRQAINPNSVADSAIEYLTPKGERKTLAYADLVDTVYRTPMRPREGAAKHSTAKRRYYLRRRVQTYRRLSASDSLCLESLERRDPRGRALAVWHI
jgi:hypothetical protein